MADCGCQIEAQNAAQRRILVWLLLINATMFGIEGLAGWLAQSTALVADSLDMLADAVVYALSLFAVGRSVGHKLRAAFLSGVFQSTLALLVVGDVIRRFGLGTEPKSALMIAVGSLALVANVVCLALIAKHRRGEIHMRASWIFSRNDVIANLSVIVAGGLVAWSQSPLPDLVIGLGLALLVLVGGMTIIRDTRRSWVRGEG
jgi:Co/Zn/Cd efflux system component